MSKTLKALTILKDTTYREPMYCRDFALRMWPDSNMHRKVSNQGNGATTGKAAWLCAGSYLSKLKTKKLVSNHGTSGYYITSEGLDKIKINS